MRQFSSYEPGKLEKPSIVGTKKITDIIWFAEACYTSRTLTYRTKFSQTNVKQMFVMSNFFTNTVIRSGEILPYECINK